MILMQSIHVYCLILIFVLEGLLVTVPIYVI